MKLKDLLSEGRFDMEHPADQGGDEGEGEAMLCAKCGMVPVDEQGTLCDGCTAEDELCPTCGRGPGDGYGADCDDPQGCGYWKDFARDAMAELRADMKKENGKQHEGVENEMFGDWMGETLRLEETRRKQNARPVVEESYGHSIQKRFQELPQNRIRIGVKK